MGLQFRKKEPSKPLKASFEFLCLSTIMLAMMNIRIFGTMWTLAMVVIAGTILYLARNEINARILKQPILVLLPGFYVLSAIWSDEPKISFSLGLQTTLEVLVAIGISACLTRSQFLRVLFIATTIVCVGSVIYGQKGESAQGLVLIGFLGSKDAMALFAYLGIMTSIAVLYDPGQKRALKLAVWPVMMIESWIALTVHATAAGIFLALGIFIFLSIHYILARSHAARWFSYFMIVFILLSGVLLSTEAVDIFGSFATQGLGKDATLTGRTVLWDEAFDLIENSPFLGHGYRSFWLGTSPETYRMLAKMGQTDGHGFHFHEQYLETSVDTGAIGLLILIATFFTFISRIWRNVIHNPSSFNAFSMSLVIIYVMRWFFETAFLPFSLDMVLFFALGTAALDPHEQKIKAPAPAKTIKSRSSLIRIQQR